MNTLTEKERKIAYLQKLIDDKWTDANCTDRKESSEAYRVYSDFCNEARMLESILETIKNQDNE